MGLNMYYQRTQDPANVKRPGNSALHIFICTFFYSLTVYLLPLLFKVVFTFLLNASFFPPTMCCAFAISVLMITEVFMILILKY